MGNPEGKVHVDDFPRCDRAAHDCARRQFRFVNVNKVVDSIDVYQTQKTFDSS
jgi:hypothetical protein